MPSYIQGCGNSSQKPVDLTLMNELTTLGTHYMICFSGLASNVACYDEDPWMKC